MATSSSLPEELIIDILLRLPVISLIRFRCVSKSWYTLLRSSAFVAKHLTFTTLNTNENLIIHTERQARQKHVIAMYNRNTQIPNEASSVNFDLPSVRQSNHVQIVGSCNGILCVSLCSVGCNLYLYNPAIKESTNLPQPQIMLPHGPRRHVVYLGFGFDPIACDYKVVRFLYSTSFKKNRPSVEVVEVYSTSVGSWREKKAVLECRINQHSSTVVLNGVIHWMGSRPSDNKDVVVCFDLANGVFREMALPGSYAYGTEFGWLPMILGESLGIVVFPVGGDRNKCVDVWAMKEYGITESWTPQVSVRLFSGVSRPIGCCRNGELIMQNNKDKLLLYDPKTREFNKLPAVNARCMHDVHGYIESLVTILEEI